MISRKWGAAAGFGFCILAVYAGWDIEGPLIGGSLVCRPGSPDGEVILLDNLDNQYELFKRTSLLQRQAGVTKVLVPVTTSDDPEATAAAEAVAAAFARIAGVSAWQIIDVQQSEPISLNAAYRIREALVSARIKSVTLVSNGFRSRRSDLIYRSVLGKEGITVSCVPVFNELEPTTWGKTWHGIQEVVLQYLKLQYYRWWILPRVNR